MAWNFLEWIELVVRTTTALWCRPNQDSRPSSPRLKGSRRRPVRFERLEARLPLIAEGTLFNVSESLNVTGLLGDLAATIDWGDGNSTTTTATVDPPGGVRVRLDYSLDTENFFNTPQKRQLMQSAADLVVSQLSDSLDAIVPSGINRWSITFFHPATGNNHTVSNPTIAANELLVYVGGRALPTGSTGRGGFGGFSVEGSPAFVHTVSSRGELGALTSPATDVGPWGGAISFSTSSRFHFGETTIGLDQNEVDFLSVAIHEMTHLLGFGTASSWERLVNPTAGDFRGPKTIAEHDGGGPVALSDELDHWSDELTDGGQEAAMTSSLVDGTRKFPTALDFAALDDIGWDNLRRLASVSASHVYADDGVYQGRLLLNDSVGSQAVKTFVVTVTNVIPTLTIVSDQRTLVNQVLTLTNLGSIEDPGFANARAVPPTNETFTYSINWGDGTPLTTGPATVDQVGSPGKMTKASFDGTHAFSQIGTFSVLVSISDDNNGLASKRFEVDVTQPPQLTIALDTATVRENMAQSRNGTVSRANADLTTAVVVQLNSTDPSELTVPATVTILAGRASANFPITAVDDTLLDGTQPVTVRATATGFLSHEQSLSVLDHEFLSISMIRNIVAEKGPPTTTKATLTRSNTDRSLPLSVTLVNNDASEVSIPAVVVIPANAASVTFVISAQEDGVSDGTQSLLISAISPGYESAEASVFVVEQPFAWRNPINPLDVNGDSTVSAIDALLLINDINDAESRSLPTPSYDSAPPPYLDVSNDAHISSIDVLILVNFLNGEVASEGEAGSQSIAKLAGIHVVDRSTPFAIISPIFEASQNSPAKIRRIGSVRPIRLIMN